MQERHERAAGWLIVALLVVGAVSRWGRLTIAWDYWAIDYVAYPFPLADDLRHGIFPWTRLVGQHPGQHGLLAALILGAGGTFRELFALSVALSVGASAIGAATLYRWAGPAAGVAFAALCAVSPYLVHYGLELNNYPLYLVGAAGLTAAFAAGWVEPTPGRLALVAVAAAVTLHGHVAGLAPVGLLVVAALAVRRWRLAGALVAGAALAVPVYGQLLGHHQVDANIHNARLPVAELSRTLVEGWGVRFGAVWSFASLGLATALAGVIAWRDPKGRGPMLLLLGLGVGGAASVVAAMMSGAAFVAQTPYWLHVAWCQLAILALGFGLAARGGRIVLFAIALPWIAFGGARAARPAAATHHLATAEPEELTRYLDEWFSPDDVLVYLWDIPYHNDDPLGRDPFFAAIRPEEVGDWTARAEPLPGYCHHFRGGAACFANDASTRDDMRGHALLEAVDRWLDAGRTVHLVFAFVDPNRGPTEPGRLRATAAARGATWRDGPVGSASFARIVPRPRTP